MAGIKSKVFGEPTEGHYIVPEAGTILADWVKDHSLKLDKSVYDTLVAEETALLEKLMQQTQAGSR